MATIDWTIKRTDANNVVEYHFAWWSCMTAPYPRSLTYGNDGEHRVHWFKAEWKPWLSKP